MRSLYYLMFTMLFAVFSVSTVSAQCSEGSITTSPSTICAGTAPGALSATTATGTGGVISYKWLQSTVSGTGPWSAASGTNTNQGYTPPTLTTTTYYSRAATDVIGTCPTKLTGSIKITVNAATAITVQPADETVCVSDDATFTVTSGGVGITFQWQEDQGSGFADISDGVKYAGTSTSSFTVKSSLLSESGYEYRVILSSTSCPDLTSSAAEMIVQTAPTVTSNPSTVNSCVDDDPTFNVAATGSNLDFQWQINKGGGFINITDNAVYSGAETTQLTVTDVTKAMDGDLFRCVVDNTSCTASTSSNATLNVQIAASVTVDPIDKTVCVNDDPTFSVTTTGDALNFKWQENSGSGFSDLANSVVYSGISTNTLTITDATAAMNTYTYRCIVDNANCPSATSASAELTVNTLPAVTSNPSDDIVCIGDATSFSASGSGTGVSLQWQEDDGGGFVNVLNVAPYSGANSSTLSISTTTAAMSGYNYRCVVTGTCTPSATSNSAELTVQSKPVITSQPSNRTICEDANTTFVVAATGSVLTYEWQVNTGSGFTTITNTGVYSTATTNTLTITGAPRSMNGYTYRVIIDNAGCASTTSNTVSLTTQHKPTITSSPSDFAVCVGNGTSISVSANGQNINHKWQFDTGSGFNDVVNNVTYGGASTAILTISSTTLAMDGYKYRCIVSGTCSPSQTSSTAELSVQVAPAITSNPTDKTVCLNDDPTFGVVTTGSSLTFQWQVDKGVGYTNLSNSALYSNVTTATMTVNDAPASVSGYKYRCVVDNAGCSEVKSTPAELTVQNPPSVTTQPVAGTVCAGNDTAFSVIASGVGASFAWEVNTGGGFGPLANNATYSGVFSSKLKVSSIPATMDGYKYRCVVSGTCSPSATSNEALLNVNTAPAITSNPGNQTICVNDDPTFLVSATGASLTFAWQEDKGSGFSNLANSTVYGGVTTGTLTITDATAAMDGYKYRCVVSGTCTPSATSSSADLNVDVSPTFTANPSDENYCTGSSMTIDATVTGTGNTLKWQVDNGGGFGDITDGATYTGSATASLSIASTPAAFDGNKYRLNASNAGCGLVSSSAATITNISAPSVTLNPVNQTVCVDGDPSFSITGTGTGIAFQWQENKGSGFNDISNNTMFAGTSTNSLAITDATAAMNGYTYRCVVSTGNCPDATSSAATLTVNSPPAITTHPSNNATCINADATITAAATGTGLDITWQEDSGSGFTDLANGGKYSGVKTGSLKITSVTAAMDGYKYRIKTSGTCTPNAFSNAATLTIVNQLTISSNPSSKTECVGDNTDFTVAASGGTLSYLWQVDKGLGYSDLANGGIYSDVDQAKLILTSVTTAENGFLYRCKVSSTCGSDKFSNAATLTIETAPGITANPSDQTTCASDNVQFKVSTSGTVTTLQWQEDKGSGFANIGNGGIYGGTSTATLTLTGVTSAMDGYEYRCVASNTGCTDATSTSAELIIKVAPQISVNSSDKSVCLGGNTSFKITATATGISYKWQEDKGIGFADLSNTGIYTGVSTNTLNLTNVALANSGYDYRCIVSGDCTPAVNSNTYELTVNQAPTITSSPASDSICAGGNTKFTAAGTGVGLSFQWQEDKGSGFTDLASAGVFTGTTTATMTITGAIASMNGYKYRCEVSKNGCGNNTSAATLAVLTAPTLTDFSSHDTVCVGSGSSFSVAAIGTDLTYQWYVNTGSGFNAISNGGIYAGADLATLTISSTIDAMDGYLYRCVIDNPKCSDVTTASAKLNVQTTPAITNHPSDETICAGGTTTLTIAHSGSPVTYQWQEDKGSGFADLAEAGIYSGTKTASLKITAPTTAANGYEYRCLVKSLKCANALSNSAELTVTTPPSISAQPSDKTTCAGTSTSFGITAAGTSISFQWQEDQGSGFANLSEAGIYTGTDKATLNISAVSAAMSGYAYRCIVDNATCAGINSNSADLTVTTSPVVTSSPSDLSSCVGDDAVFKIAASGSNLVFKWQEDQGLGFVDISNGGKYSGQGSAELKISVVTAAFDTYSYRVALSGSCTPNVISDTADLEVQTPAAVVAQPAAVITCLGEDIFFKVVGSGSNLTYQWQVDQGSGFSNVLDTSTYTGSNSDSLSITDIKSYITSHTYRVIVDNSACASATSLARGVTITPSPSITSQPSAQTICEGENTSFTVTASGAGKIYQWQEDQGSGFVNLSNSAPYSGVTSDKLDLTNVPFSMNGYDYRVVVTGSCSPAAISSSVNLRVDDKPAIATQPVDVESCEKTDATFTLAATGTGLSYQWQQFNGTVYVNLTNGLVYQNVDTDDLTIKNVTQAMDGDLFRCIVSSGNCPSVTSDIVELGVLIESIAPTISATVISFCEGGSTDLSAAGGIAGDGSTIEWYTGPNGTGVNVASGAGPITVFPTDTTTYYVRREGTCNTTDDSTITIFVQPKPTVNFTVTDACEGNSTTFMDQTIILQDRITKYEWDLGDASTTSRKNVNHIYSAAGSYDVQLIATTSNFCSDTLTKTVGINKMPKVDFTVASVCLGGLSEFKNSSSINSSATLSFDWSFGDGKGSSPLVNPEYTYAANGGYTISLKATSSDGCADSVSKATTIYSLPTADFDFDEACLGDDVALFNKSKIAIGSMTYEWDFKDASTSTATDPTHTYTTAGTRDIQLIATSNRGCKDTLEQAVATVALPTADFSFVSSCEDAPINFTDKSVSPTSSKLTYDWDFDNGGTSTSKNPQATYTTSGTYDVELTVTSAEGCVDAETINVPVFGKPQVNFTSVKVCSGNATTFSNLSIAADLSGLSYIWRFGDGDTSLRVSPAHIYTGQGTYTAKLIAISGNGCSDSITSPVVVNANPIANFRTSNVCEADSAEFINSSNVSTGTITSFWKFGDNTTSIRTNPKHKYGSDNIYRARLIVESDQGCIDSTTKAISIFPMPEPDFSFSSKCLGEDINFLNQSVIKTGTQYAWTFGDGFGATTENPSHTYLKEGSYNASLVATTANGCVETSPIRSVTVFPRVDLNFSAANVCDNDSVEFLNASTLSTGTVTYTWSYGDGNSKTGSSPVHTYDTFGVYTVTLYGQTNNSCIDSIKKTVEVYAQPIAKYSVASDCEGDFSDFQNKTTYPTATGINFAWDFDDGFTSSIRNVKHVYENAGSYNTQLIAVSEHGCSDTTYRSHNVFPTPEADFKVFGPTLSEVKELCLYETVNLTDVSTISAGNIVNWEWNYGDGSPTTTGLSNVQKNYLLNGVYTIELSVESDSGCFDIATEKIEVLPKPAVDFTFNDTCAGFGVDFKNQSTVDKGQVSYIWEFGDNEQSTLKEPTHTYLNPGTYDVTLVGLSTDGCVDTAGPKQIVIHEVPNAEITSSISEFQFCDGDSITLSTIDNADFSYLWSTGETTSSIKVSESDVYEVTITSSFGCVASSKEEVKVFELPTADAGDDVEISKGFTTQLNGSGGLFYTWSPVATLSDSAIANPIAKPLDNQQYVLVVEDGNGCTDADSVTITVNEDFKVNVGTLFTPNGDGFNDTWIIENISTYPECEVIIANRWQQVVFQTKAYANDWDGTTGGKDLPTGAYNFVINCGGKVYTGTVSIIR